MTTQHGYSLMTTQSLFSHHKDQFGQFGLNEFKRGQTHFSQLHISLDPGELESLCAVLSLKMSQNKAQTFMHIIRRFVKSLYNIHQCLRCILGHSQSLTITLANPRLAVIELQTTLQLFSLSVSRDI